MHGELWVSPTGSLPTTKCSPPSHLAEATEPLQRSTSPKMVEPKFQVDHTETPALNRNKRKGKNLEKGYNSLPPAQID